MIDMHAHALEAFNRVTRDPVAPELQLVPPEELQADLPLHGATIPFWIYPAIAALAFVLTVIGAHTI